jgi:hypothetical protein
MNDAKCERCEFFASAYTCMDKPAWGHCMWAGFRNRGNAQSSGLFTWADDSCVNFRAKHEEPVSRRP